MHGLAITQPCDALVQPPCQIDSTCSIFVLFWLVLQVFKITLEYWNFFVPDVFSSVSTLDVNAPFAFGGPVAPSNRKALYAAVLSRLRLLMITRMAKPEEVRTKPQPGLEQSCCDMIDPQHYPDVL
jgi:hypothetical protein